MVQLAPEVISSLDGTLDARVLVLSDRDPVGKGKAVELTIDYTDRNGTPHTIAPIDGVTDDRGAFDGAFEGLTWDGTGTVHATVGGIAGDATFAVLDRTPPQVTITVPATVRVNANAQFEVHVTDEIGVSQVSFEASTGGGGGGGGGGGQRSTVVASGSTDAMLGFNYQANDTQVGQTVSFYALASDLSGNEAAATPVTVTISQ
jgi:hypothetical protein